VGGFNLAVQQEWIRYCNAQPIDAFLLVTPLYSKPGPAGQIHWFTSLMDV
jgi:4-hydroxy-tetrahydrodipicolinate synthase